MLKISQRIDIIEESDFDDAVILKKNYRQLIRETSDPAEVAVLVTLRNFVQLRLDTLQKDKITNYNA